MIAPLLSVRDLKVRHPSEGRPLLRGIDLELATGEVLGLVGRSGSGKSTLMHALAGLVPWLHPAEVSGDVRIDGESVQDLDPGQRARLVATCLDRPEAQLFLHTPRQELEAAERLHGPSELAARAVTELGLGRLLERRITELSSGQRQRVALAVALSGAPRPILLDEPTAHLDSEGARALVRLLDEACALGGGVVLSEQAGWRVDGGVGRWLRLHDGVVDPCSQPAQPAVAAPDHAPGDEVVLTARDIQVDRGGQTLLKTVDLELRAGEIVAVTGPNGSGKSTLARTLAGFARVAKGRVARSRAGVALMLPDAELQLFSTSVTGELAAAGAAPAELAKVLRRHRLEHLAARAPWTLSRGERQRLVHAALDVLRPAVLVVDEPGQGLDPEDLVQLLDLIRRRAAKGRAYLIISHRQELAAFAHRHLRVEDSSLVEVERGGFE